MAPEKRGLKAQIRTIAQAVESLRPLVSPGVEEAVRLLDRELAALEEELIEAQGEVVFREKREGLSVAAVRVRCGKPSCRCARGHLHGPYWYAYWRDGRPVSRYIGPCFRISEEEAWWRARAARAGKAVP